jgi:hypothetical protein
LASVAGFIWLVAYGLSWFGLIDLPTGVPSLFPALALILVGRALRTRARRSEPTVDRMVTIPEPVPPELTRSYRDQDVVVDVGRPPMTKPAPRPADPEPVTTPLPAPEVALSPPKMEGPESKVKTSRELIEEARARWGKKG